MENYLHSIVILFGIRSNIVLQALAPSNIFSTFEVGWEINLAANALIFYVILLSAILTLDFAMSWNGQTHLKILQHLLQDL